ncbi:ElyC/SanA/YdcF family protein [Candidatus Albibeggiatoa sp. nov. NOAA]|uniref:SanA/YdcF family protein n=1 Tax=Candidatus Albibeggiatoa sp. nov. NOAA TaxID=3162724 RepID=UPI0032F6AF5F|nr:YdcF family protein [Thiotrichaceae bacterium]
MNSFIKLTFKSTKWVLISCFLLTGLGLLIIVFCNVWINEQTKNRLYSDVEQIQPKKVALVLGANKYVAGGRINLFFRFRMEAAAKLYHAGKVQHILVSGDNGTRAYNEPVEMQKYLVELGIPAEKITLDYAGFRTLDSVVRANKVFQQDDFIVVSQAFHNRRALFIADHYHIQAIGFNAQDVAQSHSLKTRVREYFAKVKAVLDLYILGTQPKFLGDAVSLPV